MKALLLTTIVLLISSMTFAAESKVIPEKDVVIRYLRKEAANDIKGKKSCWAGAVKAKDAEMENELGGRYSEGETPAIDAHLISEENARQIDKYCHTYLDKNKKPVDDSRNAAYALCSSSYSSTYVGSAGFHYSTTGSFGTSGILTVLTYESRYEALVDLNADDDNIVSYRKVSSEITCKNLAL
jgi:hypothetical protein